MRTLCDRARTPRSDLTSPSTGNESETQAQLATTDAKGKKRHTIHWLIAVTPDRTKSVIIYTKD